jgi:hypothetical protein
MKAVILLRVSSMRGSILETYLEGIHTGAESAVVTLDGCDSRIFGEEELDEPTSFLLLDE